MDATCTGRLAGFLDLANFKRFNTLEHEGDEDKMVLSEGGGKRIVGMTGQEGKACLWRGYHASVIHVAHLC